MYVTLAEPAVTVVSELPPGTLIVTTLPTLLAVAPIQLH